MNTKNETMMQYFEWYLPNDGLWWKRCAAKAKRLSGLGVTAVWLPPAYKGISQEDVGYGVYDLYDLGEFDQKGTVRTKYGTREEYLQAISAFHAVGIRVFGDIVLNHRMGGDATENVKAVTDSAEDRLQQLGDEETVKVWSRFTFPGRKGKYSRFTWNHTHFTGTDYAENAEYADRIFRFKGKHWAPETDPEKGNFDYLMGMNVDTQNPVVVRETEKWLRWYLEVTGIDGLRLDAVKHISFPFYRDLLASLRGRGYPDLPAVGEYWSGDTERLQHYLEAVNYSMSLFDVPLHYHFFEASEQGRNYDMREIFRNTLVQTNPGNAVTFVDNHDTQLGQSLQSFIRDEFKPLAYALILLRQDGIPCVFYSDYYGNPVRNRPMVPNLGKMMKIRRFYAYGEQVDAMEDPHLIGWVRRGDPAYPASGIAVVLSNAEGGQKRMEIGRSFAGQSFHDALGNCAEPVTIDEEGFGLFSCQEESVSIWVQDKAYEALTVTE